MGDIWTPRDYQLESLDFFLANPKAGLFLDPGYGKTSVTLAAVKMLLAAERTRGVLLIAPLRVMTETWPDEVAKWGSFEGISFKVLHKAKLSIKSLREKKDIYLINPEGLAKLKTLLAELVSQGFEAPFDTLWVDESSKFKNHKSKQRFKTLKLMLPLFTRVKIMTGTPAPKNYLNLWPQIYLLDRGKALGTSFYKFRAKYFEPTDYKQYNWVLKPGAGPQIAERISHLVLDLSNRSKLKLPDLIENDIAVELPDRARSTYVQMEKKMFAMLDGDVEVTAKAKAQAIQKCHQIANGSLYEDLAELDSLQPSDSRKAIVIHEAKIQALIELVDELQGKPLLVAYRYKHDLAALKSAFGETTPHIGGGVSLSETSDMVKKWRLGEVPILLGQPVAMSHGLNMQGSCNDVCWFSLPWWDLEEYLQFNARVLRSGAKGPSVRIHHLIAKDSVDEAIMLNLRSKDKAQLSLRATLQEYRSRKVY